MLWPLNRIMMVRILNLVSKLLYFAYGSNLHPDWFRSRISSAKKLHTEILYQWQLHFHKIGRDESAKCNIIKTDVSDDSVHGVIYRFNYDEKYILDEFEHGYRSVRMSVGGYEDVLVYLACNEKINNAILPYTWYKDIVVAGAHHHNLPQEYINFLKSVRAIKDPDNEREQRNRLIVRSI